MRLQVQLRSITGYEDAFAALLMSKRSWTNEKDNAIREAVYCCTEANGSLIYDSLPDRRLEKSREVFDKWMEKVVKWKDHITLLKFINFSFTVIGLHRGGQDDWDAHAERFNNRIIRNSTRLSKFAEGEMSDFYKGKIIPATEACELLGIELPYKFEREGVTFVKTINGYIREDLKEDKDTLRGLYMMSIPSTFIFDINAAEWAHVYKMRNKSTGAHPEVKQVAEMIADLLEEANPYFTREFWMSIPN